MFKSSPKRKRSPQEDDTTAKMRRMTISTDGSPNLRSITPTIRSKRTISMDRKRGKILDKSDGIRQTLITQLFKKKQE